MTIDAFAIPCRACKARPGTPCASFEAMCPTREADAKLVEIELAKREASPAVSVRKKCP